MEDGSKDWRRIAGRLFPREDETPDEAFVRGVMARIEAAESGPRLVSVPARWFAPALGVAAMLVLALLPARDGFTADALLFGGDASAAAGVAGEDALGPLLEGV